MKTITSLILVFSIALSTNAQTFNVNPDASKITWRGEKVTGSHVGTIKILSGSMTFDKDALVGGEFIIDLNSMNCTDLEGEYKKNLENHLKSPDFFDAENHPTAKFEITSVSMQEDKYRVRGYLTIKDITKSQELKVTITEEGKIKVASGEMTIDRAKYNMKFNSGSFFDDLGDKLIYDDFTLTFNVKAS